MVMLFNRLFYKGEFPDSWSTAIIIQVHKKGNHNDPANLSRKILALHFSKIYTSILNRNLSFYAIVFNKIDESQSGFRAGYSTTDNAFVLQSLISKALSKKRGKFYVAFVDFKTAFDSVNRNRLWHILYNANILGNLLNSIFALYNTLKACVRSSGHISD
jgi:hypothetical protein